MFAINKCIKLFSNRKTIFLKMLAVKILSARAVPFALRFAAKAGGGTCLCTYATTL